MSSFPPCTIKSWNCDGLWISDDEKRNRKIKMLNHLTKNADIVLLQETHVTGKWVRGEHGKGIFVGACSALQNLFKDFIFYFNFAGRAVRTSCIMIRVSFIKEYSFVLKHEIIVKGYTHCLNFKSPKHNFCITNFYGHPGRMKQSKKPCDLAKKHAPRVGIGASDRGRKG